MRMYYEIKCVIKRDLYYLYLSINDYNSQPYVIFSVNIILTCIIIHF